MENNEGQIPATAVNDAGNNTKAPSDNFGVEQVEQALRASMFDDTTETAPTEAENDVESPEVESEGEQEADSVHSESQEETTAEADEQDSQGDEPEEDYSEDADRGLPRGIKKRIDKLVAKRREAEQKVEQMKAELERLGQEAAKPARTAEIRKNPFANLETPEQVQSEIERAKQIRRWCEMNPDGAVVKDAEGNETEYTSEQIRQIKVKSLEAVEEHLPAQLAYITNFMQVEQVAAKEYPWWKDKSSKERQIADAFIKHFPEITRFPDYKMVLGDYIRGVKSRTAASKSAAPQRVPSQPKMSGVPTSQTARQAASKDSLTRFRSSGGKEDLSSIIASKFL